MKRTVLGALAIGFLIAVSVAPGGCAPGTGEEPLRGIDLLDRMELLGVPAGVTETQPLDSRIVEPKLGKVVRRAVAFPPQREITLDFPRLPEGAAFTCAVGVRTQLGVIPESRFAISRITASGVKTQLETLWLEEGSPQDWYEMSADLGEFAGQEIRLRIEAAIGSRNAQPFLASPRLVVPTAGRGDGEGPRHAVLICIDTLRADHVGCYGCPRPLTPSLDALAGEAVRFAHCESASPWTLPSVAATITGRYPGMIAADADTEHLRPEETTLAELFHVAGFRTAAVTNNRYVSVELGFFQGCEYQRESPKAPADEQVDAALAWIESHLDEDFYLYIHLFDPHVPYIPPEPYLSRFRRGSGRFVSEFSDPNGIRSGELVLTDEEVQQIRGLYDGCIAFSDAEVGRMIDRLRELETWGDMAFVVYADHGEEFWEHGGYEHGHSVYEEVIHVPLLVKLPGQPAGVREDTVGLVDVLPTFVNWAGLETPEGLMGRDLFGEADESATRRFFSEECIHATESKAIIEGDWKLIVHFDGETGPELYNLADDPGELINRARAEPELFETLMGELLVYAGQTSEGCHLRLYPTEDARGNVFRVTATVRDGMFRDATAEARGEIIEESVEAGRLLYEARLGRGNYLALDFFVEPEDAEVSFTVQSLESPETSFPWYLGASGTPFDANEFAVSMTDERIAMSYPQARVTNSQGVYVWSVPPSVRTQFEGTLSPETLEELRSLGYIQ